MKIIENIRSTANSIFTNPVISTVFSGIGTSLLSYIKKRKKQSDTKSNTHEREKEQQSHEESLTQKEIDIRKIKHTIQYGLNQEQDYTFTRYFNKYKGKLPEKDVEGMESQAAVEVPNYGRLLSQLLGLIETLEE